jgi:uncharacterized protein YndB with AHSA1/START domain
VSNPIDQEVVVPAAPERVYEAYMSSREHEAFTKNGHAEISRDPGGAFSAHGGFISGRNLDLVPGRRIVQAWRAADWPEGTYSIVRLDLEPAGPNTRLRLHHDGFPDANREHLASGWTTRYWEPLKEYFGRS